MLLHYWHDLDSTSMTTCLEDWWKVWPRTHLSSFSTKEPLSLTCLFSLNQASFSWRILLYLINLMNILPWHQIFRIMPIQKNRNMNMSSLREHSQHELSSLTRKTVFFFPSGKVFLCLIALSGTKLRMYMIVISLSEMFTY